MDEQIKDATTPQEMTPEGKKREMAKKRPAKARAARSHKKKLAPGAATPKSQGEVHGSLQKHAEHKPWKPARVMDIPDGILDPRYRYRWVNKSKMGNVLKKRQEGWEPDFQTQKKIDEALGFGAMAKTLDDSAKSLDSTTQVRELILMRMPVELAEERSKFYERQTIDPPRHAKKLLRGEIDRQSREAGGEEDYGEVYGGIKEQVGNRKVATQGG